MSEIKLVLDGVDEPVKPESENKELAVTTEQILTEVERLSDEEMTQIQDFAGKIDLHKPEIVANYGATVQQQSAAIATKTLNDVKTKNTGEVSGLLVEMVSAMDSIEGGNDRSGFLSNILNKLKVSAKSIAVKNESAEKTLERIEKQLEGHKLALQKDVAMLEDLYEENWTTFKALTMYIKAAEIALQDARDGELKELYAKAEASGKPEDAMLADTFSKSCDMFEKQIHNLRLTRTSCLQSAPQIKVIQQNDQELQMKLQSSIVNTLPLWRKKVAMAIAVNNNLVAAKAATALDDMTNRMLREQAEQFHMGVIESAKASQRSIIDLETIDYVNKEITGAVLDYIAIEQQGAKDRQEAVKVIAASERELVEGVLSATAKSVE